jgi:uncharacterized LabA/DUF88 family protein
LSHPERLNIAVFIDFDNIEIGVKTTLNEHFDVGIVLDAIKERGEVVTKIAYADWTRAGEYSRHLTQHAIRLVQRNLTPGGDKNGADINLALDALEMVFTHQHINAYVIVGGDSDFLSLVEKLKQYDKKVFVCGGRAFTSMILQRNCHEFIAYENLTRSRRPAVKGDKPVTVTAASPIAQAFAIVRRALKILSDREVSPQTGLLKSTLLQLDSTFSERNYGASSFLDFAEKLAQAGLVTLKHSGRSVMVELNDGFDDGTAGQGGPNSGTGATTEPDSASPSADGAGVAQGGAGVVQVFRPANDRPAGDQSPAGEPPPQAGDQAEGVRLVGQILRNSSNARWPMYLRNVKQILRATDGGFDERRYGFGGLMDLLRACQRDGLVRVERDRRGGLRVFPSQGLQRAEAAPVAQVPDLLDSDAQPTEIEPGNRLEVDALDAEQPDSEVVPIDTTAELLGRAGAKPRRTRVAVAARGTRKAAVRKPAARRPRSKKEAE